MRAFLSLGLLGTAVLLAGCAGRDANPEPVDWAYDHYYTCQDIHAEKVRIVQAMVARGVEENDIRHSDNDLMARSIPLLPPALLAVDQSRMSGSRKSAQQLEIDGLKARNAHLDSMATDRGC
jgi:hypothetical protein